MDRPASSLPLLLAALIGSVALSAQEPVVTTTGSPRAVSPRVAQLLIAARPKYEALKTGETDSEQSAVRARLLDRPANGIVRLPDYVVREARLPTAEQVMTRKAIAQRAMNKYLGPADGFDRGFLNAVTLPELRQKIPFVGFLLGLIPSMTNEQRAMMYYYEDKRLEDMKYFNDLASLPGPNGDASNNAKLKREIQKAFMRD